MALQRLLGTGDDEDNDDSDDDSDAWSDEAVNQAHELLWYLIRHTFLLVIWMPAYAMYMLFYVMYLLLPGAKEIVCSFAAYINMICFCPIVNLCLYIPKRLGFFQDRNYINPWRLFLAHSVETSKIRILTRVTAVWIGLALLLVYMPDVPDPQSSPEKTVRTAEEDMISKYIGINSPLPERFKSDMWKSALEMTIVNDSSKDGHWKTKLQSWLSISPRSIFCSACNRFCAQSKIMLPDHALTSTGSRVLMELTSSTFGGGDKNKIPAIFMQFITMSGMPHPVAALTDYQHAGACWPMAGKQGSLGVRLYRPVSVKAVSIDYMDFPQVIESNSAPADFEVWGLTYKHRGLWDTLALSEEEEGKVYLGRFKYDINKPNQVQTFNVQHSSAPIKDVVFRFLDNWGHDNYTCIYRVRVHGVVV